MCVAEAEERSHAESLCVPVGDLFGAITTPVRLPRLDSIQVGQKLNEGEHVQRLFFCCSFSNHALCVLAALLKVSEKNEDSKIQRLPVDILKCLT